MALAAVAVQVLGRAARADKVSKEEIFDDAGLRARVIVLWRRVR